MPEPLVPSWPDHGGEALRADEGGGTLRRAAAGQWRLACALLGEGVVLFPGAQGPDAAHAEAALAACDEGPEHLPSCSRLVQLARGGDMPLPLLLGFVNQFDGDHRWGGAPKPGALGASAPPRLARPPSVCCGLTLRGDARLAISVTRLPGRDTLGEEVSPRGPVPDVVLARGGCRGGGVQPWGNLPTTSWFGYPGARERAHAVSLRGLKHPLRSAARPFRPLPVSSTRIRPRQALPPPGCLPPAPPRPFGKRGALILRAHAVHVRPPCARRTLADRLEENDHLRLHRGARFAERVF